MRELVRLLKFAALDLFAGLDLRWAPDGLSVNPNNNGIRNLMLRMKVTRLNFTTSASGSETRTWSWRRFVCIRHLKKNIEPPNPGPAMCVRLLHVRWQARRQPARADRAAAHRVRYGCCRGDDRQGPTRARVVQGLPHGFLCRVPILCATPHPSDATRMSTVSAHNSCRKSYMAYLDA